MTERNVESLPEMLDLMDREDIDKFYLSHLVYAGRGNRYREDDAYHQTTRDAMNLIFERCWRYVERGIRKEFVTGNNDADGVFFLQWVRERFPDSAEHIRKKLELWGGNCVGRERRQYRQSRQCPPRHLLVALRSRQRQGAAVLRDLAGRFRSDHGRPESETASGQRPLRRLRVPKICNGNTRVRAMQLTGDAWAEDPACYLTDDEIGVRRRRTPHGHALSQTEEGRRVPGLRSVVFSSFA